MFATVKRVTFFETQCSICYAHASRTEDNIYRSPRHIMAIMFAVIMAAKADCHAHRPIVISDTSGYLASLTAAETGCGTSDAPWLIKMMPGQRINVTLFDFSPPDVALHGQVPHRLLPNFNPLKGRCVNWLHSAIQV